MTEPMHIAIKNPAPAKGQTERWGDTHFGLALQRAMEAEGVRVSQHFFGEWDRDDGEDAILVLRGARRFEPPRGKPSVLWVISHPASVSLAELDAYTLAYLGSETHRDMLGGVTRRPVEVLRQCSDFRPPSGLASVQREGVIFVGNSRGIYRDIVRWAVASGVRPKIYGRAWKQIGLEELVVETYAANDSLPEIYSRARLSLNDHWNDMKYFGYINNRLFDSVFCGLPVLTDRFPELERVFGGSLLYADDAPSLARSFATYERDYPAILDRVARLAPTLADDYSFAARARRIIADLKAIASRGAAVAPTARQIEEAPLGFRDVVAAVAAHVATRERSTVLHVHPSIPGGEAFERKGVTCLSAGFGLGPWEVGLDEDLTPLAHRLFDAVVIEDGTGIDRKAARRLVARVRPAGLFAASPELAADIISGGMVEVLSNPSWRLLRAP